MATQTQPAAHSAASRYWDYALWLALFTVFYNLIEGLVATYFGAQDEALTLFGFGVDSFIELISGVGILVMVLRIRRNPDTPRSQFEQAALRITGVAFYLLALGLAVTAFYNLLADNKPATTLPGFIISSISILVMWLLVIGKRRVGRTLDSAPILADANCTLVCIYMSLVLMASSALYQVTRIGVIDTLGAAGLIYFSIKEGREAFYKARHAGALCGCEESCSG